MFNQLEKKIIAILMQIENKKITKAESGIGKMLNTMKGIDLPAYENLMERYKKL